jgi:hypothetical protein
MCFVLFAGTVNTLPRVAFNNEAPGLSVESLTERDAAVRQHFSNPEVQYVGSTCGCGCDFPNVLLQNGSWPTLDSEETEKDEFEVAADIRHRHNCKLLVSLLRANGDETVELYGFWHGDDTDIANPPHALEDISLDRILDSDFRFKEQVLYRIHAQSDAGN